MCEHFADGTVISLKLLYIEKQALYNAFEGVIRWHR